MAVKFFLLKKNHLIYLGVLALCAGNVAYLISSLNFHPSLNSKNKENFTWDIVDQDGEHVSWSIDENQEIKSVGVNENDSSPLETFGEDLFQHNIDEGMQMSYAEDDEQDEVIEKLSIDQEEVVENNSTITPIKKSSSTDLAALDEGAAVEEDLPKNSQVIGDQKSIAKKKQVQNYIYAYATNEYQQIRNVGQTAFDRSNFKTKVGHIESTGFSIKKLNWQKYKNLFVNLSHLETLPSNSDFKQAELRKAGNIFRLNVTTKTFKAFNWLGKDQVSIMNGANQKFAGLKPLFGIKDKKYYGFVPSFIAKIKTFYRGDGNHAQGQMYTYNKEYKCYNTVWIEAHDCTIMPFGKPTGNANSIAQGMRNAKFQHPEYLNKETEYWVKLKDPRLSIDLRNFYSYSKFGSYVLIDKLMVQQTVRNMQFIEPLPALLTGLSNFPFVVLDPIK